MDIVVSFREAFLVMVALVLAVGVAAFVWHLLNFWHKLNKKSISATKKGAK